ncbi:unnamed protein product [Rotaria sordida]|uniref:Phospholipid/glycerol acyltransferase domain-containing protein n=1 Tax=Rotaria sordida TaxID=392033 RepID=A0A814FE05_9BILA|nr:unnamed protein product [Rotaria sordida]
MELLVSFLNRDNLSHYITTSMSNILTYQNESNKQEKEIEELSQLLDALPTNIHFDSISIASQLFDYLLQNSPSTHQYRLLSSCLNLMKIEDRLQRIKTILLLILDNEQTVQLRELLCKLLNTIEHSASLSLNFDWTQLESAINDQHDPKFLTYIWRFFSKNHQTNLEQILVRTLPIIKTNDELFLLLLIDLRSTKVFVSMSSFWYLIQRSLGDSTSNNDRIRKCALYLFQQILTNDEYKHIEIKEEKFNRLLILIDEKTKQFWIDFIVVYEVLEDGVVHLIKPLLTKFDRFLNFSLEHGLSLTWLFILLQRLFANTSSPLARWTVRWFLNSMKLPENQAENFFLETVLDWSSNNFIFLKGEEINDSQPMEQCLESYLERWLNHVENPSSSLLTFLSRIQTIKWSHISLVRVLYSLRTYALKHQNQSLLNDEHIKIFSSLILTQFHTYAPVLRLSAYSSIFDTVIYLLDWSISSISLNLLRFFALFDRLTFLSKHFQMILNHFSFDIRQLKTFIEEFLSSEDLNTSLDTRLFSLDNTLLEYRQIVFLLDLIDIHNTDILKIIFNPLIENIRTAYQRPYMSINNVQKSIELFLGLIQENYFHSLNFVKDWLSSSIRLIVREGLNFIKIHSIKQPMVFVKSPIVFLMIGNHGDISRFLQESINQMETMIQQQSGNSWQSLFILFIYSMDWLLTNRLSDFNNEWNTKLRTLPLFSQLLPLLDQPNSNIPQADMLIAKYLFIANNISSMDLCNNIIDDLYKASPRELPYVFRAIGVLLRQIQTTNENKCKLIENSTNVLNEIDHRMPVYWPCLTAFCQAISSSVTDVNVSDLLTQWFTQMFERCGHISGIMNVILESIIPIWLQEHRIQLSHLPILIECIIFGQIYQKDRKQQWQAEQLVEQDESFRLLLSNTHIIPEYRYDRNIRVLIQLFVLHIWPSLLNVQQNDIVMQIIEKHRHLALKERRPRFCTNSLEHRIMFRSLQCLLCLTSVIKNPSLVKTIYDYIVETLIRENEPSLRLLSEWIIVRLILEDRATRLNNLYEYLHHAHQHRTGTVCAWLSIASHIPTLLLNRIEQIEYINKIFEYISPLLMHSNFHIRTFACSTMVKLLEYTEHHHLENETPYEAYRYFKRSEEKSELGRYIMKLQSLFLYQFDPIRDFSLETIFYTLPKLSLIADDEYLWPEWFIEISQQLHLSFPISVYNVSTILQSCQAGIWRLTATGKTEIGGMQDEEGSSTIQHKANPYPIVEALDDTELRESIKRSQLIVVASLIDKQANLGGLCRTGEIFGIKELVIGSVRILEDQQFLNLSMTAHKWLRIKQVQERELKDYLIDMQTQGYTIVAVEQTVNSQSLYEFKFPEKTLLLLGNEREGIRADLLSLVNATVEIPQAGVVRSLNVHVSGALCISEYTRNYNFLDMRIYDEFKSMFITLGFLGYIFLASGLIINFLQLCSCVIWPFSKELYRKINCYLALGIWSQFTFVAQWWSKSNCVLYIKPEELEKVRKEHAIVIMNHKYDVDWLAGWIICQRLGIIKGSKIVGKQSLKLVPIVGWCWIFAESIFLRRVWESDRETLVKDLRKVLANYPKNYFFNLLLFCEGTRFTEKKRLTSMKIAQEKGLPELKHHILPRTKGFTLLLQGAENRITAVYDLTIGFKHTGAEPTLLSVLKGRSCQAEIFVKRIPTSEIPQDTEGCSNWVHQLYQEKDKIYDYFLKHGTFEGNGLPRIEIQRNYYDLLIELAWMLIIGVPSLIYLFKFLWTSSLLAQLAFVALIFIATIGVRAMIAVTETERGSHYGETQKEK